MILVLGVLRLACLCQDLALGSTKGQAMGMMATALARLGADGINLGLLAEKPASARRSGRRSEERVGETWSK